MKTWHIVLIVLALAAGLYFLMRKKTKPIAVQPLVAQSLVVTNSDTPPNNVVARSGRMHF
jgi:flagellar biosynthesis protein FliP